jgi:hypothetical protein
MSIFAGQVGGWCPASAGLSGIFDVERTIADGLGGRIDVKRKGTVRRTGWYDIREGFVSSLIPKPVLVKEDPYSRKAVCLTSGRTPVFTASPGKIIRAFPGAIKPLISRDCGVSDNIVILGGFYSHCNNYFHYWIDVIADLWFMRQRWETLGRPSLVMPYAGLKWQDDILLLCGIDREQVIPLSEFSALRASRVRVAVRARGGHVNPPWLIRALREVSGFALPAEAPWRRIYVSRLGALRRPVSNELAVIDALEQSGFEIIDCGRIPVEQQRKVFSEAQLIVASHGAALTNLAWCSPQSRVIEFLPDRHGNPCFSDFARMVGMQYQAIVCAQDAAAGNVIEAGYEVPLEKLLRLIEDGDQPPRQNAGY